MSRSGSLCNFLPGLNALTLAAQLINHAGIIPFGLS